MRRIVSCLVVLALWACSSVLGILASAPVAPGAVVDSDAQDVTIVSSSAYQSGAYLCVVGEVRNETAGNVRSVRITATYYDGSGGVLGTAVGYTRHSVLVPAQKSPFLILHPFPAGYASYDLAVTYSTTDLTPAPQLLIRSVRQLPDVPGWLTFVGELENSTPSNVEFVEVFLVLYDGGGKVINVGSAYVFIEVLTPGQRAPFRLYLSSGPVTYASYAFSTEADLTTYDPYNLRTVNVAHRIQQDELHFTGEVENLEPTEVEFVQAFVTLYDASGNIVNCDYAFTDPDTIRPGGRASFDIVFADNYQGWTSYSVYPPLAAPTTPTPTATASATHTATPAMIPTPTGTPTVTSVPPSATPSATLTPTRTEAMTASPTPTATASHTASPTPSPTQTPATTPTPTVARARVYLPVVVRRVVRGVGW